MRNNELIVVGVAGSLGKSGTKRAIATVLSEKYRVRWQDGNYNDIVSVPLVFFGLPLPSLMNPFAWTSAFAKMRKQIKNFPYDVVVLELGTDGPGQITKFQKYLLLDIGVITRIAPEHIEYFGSLAAVAEEELSLQDFSKKLLVHEEIPEGFGDLLKIDHQTFGKNKKATARFEYDNPKLKLEIEKENYDTTTNLIGKHQMWGLTAAALVAQNLGMSKTEIEEGVSKVTPMPGRMNILRGIKGSTIIDDTYNASAEAMIAALDTLGSYNSPHRIAVLGNMNEMGSMSAELHARVGKYIDPKMVHLVITLGPDANEHLAKAAQDGGCEVVKCNSPMEVGEMLKEKLHENATVLFKGSQNGVFLEEAVKAILNDPADSTKLVRQSPDWLSKK